MHSDIPDTVLYATVWNNAGSCARSRHLALGVEMCMTIISWSGNVYDYYYYLEWKCV